MHGWRSSWSHDFGIIAPFWHDNDCCVLFAEQRGQGLSGGNYMGFGMLGIFVVIGLIAGVTVVLNKLLKPKQ
jgi:hypothetical protein